MIFGLVNREPNRSKTARDPGGPTNGEAAWDEAEAWAWTSPASLLEPEAGRVLLACRDRASQKWGPRWLSLAGLRVVPAFSDDEALSSLAQGAPSLVIAEASLSDERGRSLFEVLLRECAKTGVPVLAMCANGRESRRALELGATDVARRPFEWQLLSRRAAWLARAFQTAAGLARARQVVADGLSLLDTVRHEAELQASTDRLTRLPTRTLFLRRLERALAAPRTGGVLAVLLVGLDRFGAVNETVGRDGGDTLLASVADRLDACLGQAELGSGRQPSVVSATVARLSGDRFGLMVTGLHREGGVAPVTEAVMRLFSGPFEVKGETLWLTASVGCALGPDGGGIADELVHHAELAMLEAKRDGGAVVRFYERSLGVRSRTRVVLHRQLRRAIAGGELELCYQPVVAATGARVVAAEALLRWRHPERGLVMPMEFIPVAEETGLMAEIGAWVIRHACQQLRAWLDRSLPPIRMLVNLSHCQLASWNLVEIVASALRETRLAPELLELEISERGMLRLSDEVLRILRGLKQLGVRLSVDDFGSGQAAIAYLKALPLDVLKIDQSYVRGASESASDAALGSAMVAMAHRLRLTVVAEGVEHREQLDYLQGWGCDELQGFHFSPPVPAGDFGMLLEQDAREATNSGAPAAAGEPLSRCRKET